MRTACLVLRDDHIEARGVGGTTRFGLADLERVEVSVGRTGPAGIGREHLVFHLNDGRTIVFKDFNAKPSRDGEPSVVMVAAAELQRRKAS
jgi:hypothetical protein